MELECPCERFLSITSGTVPSFLHADRNAYVSQVVSHNISKNYSQPWLVRLSNFYMLEYCENFEIAFSKILDFRRRLKFALKLPHDISND